MHVVDLARQSRAMVFAWLNPCTSGLVARQMEELEESFAALCADGARQVRLACAKPQTSSGPGPGGRAYEGV